MPALSRVGLIILAAAWASASPAGQPAALTDLQAALDKARAENKLAFIQYGREACGNCQALKKLIADGRVRLPDNTFVYADICCDDAGTAKLFRENFKVSGRMLPFVVIADPSGKQLAARSGYGEEVDFEKLIKEARSRYKKTAAAAAAPALAPASKPQAQNTSAGSLPYDAARPMRSWKPQSGLEIKASLLKLANGTATLRKEGGAMVMLPLTSLSQEDQDYIGQLQTGKTDP